MRTYANTHERICYQVVATLPDEATAAEYVVWLQDGHVDQVVAAGAHAAMVVRLEDDAAAGGRGEGGKPRVMTQYVFSTREAFERYVAVHAPALRADGLKRFGPERGVSFQRVQGVIV